MLFSTVTCAMPDPDSKIPSNSLQESRFRCLAESLHVEQGACLIALIEGLWLFRQLYHSWINFDTDIEITKPFSTFILLVQIISLLILLFGIYRRQKWCIVPEIIVQLFGIASILIGCGAKIFLVMIDETGSDNILRIIPWLIVAVLTVGLKIWSVIVLRSYFLYLCQRKYVL